MSIHSPTSAIYVNSQAPQHRHRLLARALLRDALFSQLDRHQGSWLATQLQLLEQLEGPLDADRQILLDMTFGLCPRKISRAPLRLGFEQHRQLCRLLPGWSIDTLRCDAVARQLLVTSQPTESFVAEQMHHLLRHADLQEQLALYRGLPLYSPSPALNDRLADGLRSNISVVFESIAHDNPYPAWYLDTHRFNHMVLKALFIDSSLAPIVGLVERNNRELARMLLDTARERRAADRKVSGELYVTASPFMSETELKDFDQALQLEKAA